MSMARAGALDCFWFWFWFCRDSVGKEPMKQGFCQAENTLIVYIWS